MNTIEKIKAITKIIGLSKEIEETKLEEVKTDEVVETKEVETKLEAQTLENGTVLEAESFEAGQDVFIVSEDERVAVPVGDYTLEDGRVLVVAEEGVIESVGDAPAEDEAPEEVEQASEFVTVADFEVAINEIKSMLTSHDEEILNKHETEKAELLSSVEDLKTELESVPASKKINSSPEAKETEEIKMNIIGANRRKTTGDRVTDMLNNFYKTNKNEFRN